MSGVSGFEIKGKFCRASLVSPGKSGRVPTSIAFFSVAMIGKNSAACANATICTCVSPVLVAGSA